MGFFLCRATRLINSNNSPKYFIDLKLQFVFVHEVLNGLLKGTYYVSFYTS